MSQSRDISHRQRSLFSRKLSTTEKAFLIFLVVAGVVYSAASAFGATSFVFVEQQQGSCFRGRPPVRPVQHTTPASRAFIFKAQILTVKPQTAVT